MVVRGRGRITKHFRRKQRKICPTSSYNVLAHAHMPCYQWPLLGWVAEERHMLSGRVYRFVLTRKASISHCTYLFQRHELWQSFNGRLMFPCASFEEVQE